jgi:hypothetical protein
MTCLHPEGKSIVASYICDSEVLLTTLIATVTIESGFATIDDLVTRETIINSG